MRCAALLGMAATLWFGAVHVHAQEPTRLDSDGDGLLDSEEDLDGDGKLEHGETDPYAADTDGDGMSDGREREIGTDPAHNGLIDFPEPMVFDMVRGLGAEQGEVEVNTLVLVPTSPAEAVWAPEIEAAVIDNLALELEAGFANADFELVKFALQGTVGMNEDRGLGHGIQGLFEYSPDAKLFLATALYILGARLGAPVSLVSLIGPAVETHVDGSGTEGGVFVNFTFFWAPHPRVVLGSEQNFEWFPSAYLIRVMPQVHWQIHARFQWQAGFGYRNLDGKSSAEASTRLIAEF